MKSIHFLSSLVAVFSSSVAFASGASSAPFGATDLSLARAKVLERINGHENVNPSTGLTPEGVRIEDVNAHCKRIKAGMEIICTATYLADRWNGEASISFVKNSLGTWTVSSEEFDGSY